MILRVIFASITLSLFSHQAIAADNITNYKLDNGMEVVVIEDHRAPVVTHMVYYRVGSADEVAGKSGIAHFLEHLLFKGTDKMEAGEFSEIVASNGGSENAFTSLDYTGYYQRVAVDRLALMMELEADRMVNLKLTEEEVIPELAVVIEERASRTDTNPNALLSEQRAAAQYMNHPYGRPVIGWRHELLELNRQDAFDFYKKYYAPNNAILIVAGDVVPSEVLELAKEHYGPLQPSDLPPRIRPQEPPHLAPIRMTFTDRRVREPYALRTYLAPQRKTGDQREAAALRIMSALLGGSGITSVMGQELVLKQKIALSASSFYSAVSLDPSTFGVYIVPTPETNLADAEAAMDQVIADFIEGEIDVDHLARIKAEIRASQVYNLDDQFGLARGVGRALTSGLNLQDVDEWSDILGTITPEEIKAAAKSVFNLNNSVTTWLLPKQEMAQ